MMSTIDTRTPSTTPSNTSGYLALAFTALAWPTWLFLVFYVYWWIPQTREALNNFDLKLPGLTLFLLNTSDWIPILSRQTFPLLMASLLSIFFLAIMLLTFLRSLRIALAALALSILFVGLAFGVLAIYAMNIPFSGLAVFRIAGF